MKKHYILIIWAIVLFSCAVFICSSCEKSVGDNTLPYSLMVDGVVYREYDVSQEKPINAIEGYITKVVLENKMPDENGAANFGNVGVIYWKSDNKIYLQTDNEFLIFVPIQD